MYENARVIPGTSLGRHQVCLHGHYVCWLGGVKGAVHLRTESLYGNAGTDGSFGQWRVDHDASRLSEPKALIFWQEG